MITDSEFFLIRKHYEVKNYQINDFLYDFKTFLIKKKSKFKITVMVRIGENECWKNSRQVLKN